VQENQFNVGDKQHENKFPSSFGTASGHGGEREQFLSVTVTIRMSECNGGRLSCPQSLNTHWLGDMVSFPAL